jgi:hypothetical protein
MEIEATKAAELQDAIGVVCDHATALRQLRRHPDGKRAERARRAEIARALRRSRSSALRVWRSSRPSLKKLT